MIYCYSIIVWCCQLISQSFSALLLANFLNRFQDFNTNLQSWHGNASTWFGHTRSVTRSVSSSKLMWSWTCKHDIQHNVPIVLSYYHEIYEIREISKYPFCSTKLLMLLPLVCVSLRKHIHPNSWRTPIRLAPMGPSRYCAFAGNWQNRRDKRLVAPGSKAPRPSPWSPTFHQHRSARATGCWWGLGKAKAVEQWGVAKITSTILSVSQNWGMPRSRHHRCRLHSSGPGPSKRSRR